jgi:hypothetical protein
MNVSDLIAIKAAVVCSQDQEMLSAFNLDSELPDKTLLPSGLRRRSGLTTLMAVTAAMSACQQAEVEVKDLPSVFASVGGEIQVTDVLCRSLTDVDYLLSPTQFHNSVHNTTAGYWSILTQCQQAATAIAAVDDTFAMAMLEAWSQLQQQPGDLLLVCYDELWPQYLAPPMGGKALACALVLTSDIAGSHLGIITRPEIRGESIIVSQDLLELTQSAPAAACIPLLQALRSKQGHDYIALNTKGANWQTQLSMT